MPKKAKILFEKSISRNTTLFTQSLWARSLVNKLPEKLGQKNPYLPFTAHLVNNGMVEIWEHKPAVDWFLNKLLEKNKKDRIFFKDLFYEYKDLLRQLKKCRAKKDFTEEKNIETYSNLFYNTVLRMTIFFYAGSDERSSEAVKKTAVEARRLADLFSQNDIFIRKKIARMGKFSQELAGVVLPEEMLNLPQVAVLKRRLKSYLLIDGREKHLGSINDFIRKNHNYEFKKEKVIVTDKGFVRVINKRDFNKMKKGEILVASMTTPDFISAMKKASAFITDEGGVTCHAAIVARELNIPAVIGTKVATKILKDGMMVEVKGNHGIVNVIEK